MKGRLVPQNPTGQGARCVGLPPLLAFTRVPPDIALLPRGILVFGIVGHSSRTEAHNLLSAVFNKDCVEFLLRPVRLADRLELQRHSTIA